MTRERALSERPAAKKKASRPGLTRPSKWFGATNGPGGRARGRSALFCKSLLGCGDVGLFLRGGAAWMAGQARP